MGDPILPVLIAILSINTLLGIIAAIGMGTHRTRP